MSMKLRELERQHEAALANATSISTRAIAENRQPTEQESALLVHTSQWHSALRRGFVSTRPTTRL